MLPGKKQTDPGTTRTEAKGEARNHAIVENIPEVLALLSAAGKIVYVNPYAENLLGYAFDELKGRNIFDFVHPDDVERAAQEYAETVQQEGERIPSVLRIRDAFGEWVPFEIVANSRLRDPEIQAVIFTARDLRFRKDMVGAIERSNVDVRKDALKRSTELARINAELRIEVMKRRKIEKKLRQAVSLLNTTLDSTADGILVISKHGKVTSCNKKFIEMWGLDCGDSIGGEDEKLLAKVADKLQKPNEFLERVQELYNDPSAISFDVLHFKDGRIFERYSQPQRLNGKKTIGRVWSFRDVTRARNLETELRQSQKMEALGRLASGIAHDFNNLLMLILGYANQILQNAAIEQAREPASQIVATARRAAAVTKQLLAFSRKQPDAPTHTDLNLIVLNIEHLLRRLLLEQIHFQVSVSSEPLPVYVDVSQIELMIMNLVLNAQDAMPEGGRLAISTFSRRAASGKTQPKQDMKSFAVLEIRDTGRGMTPEVQAHIFEPFFTTKQLGRGTGLGLSAVLGIVERAGGRIEVHSEPNRGATFEVFLPQVEAEAARVITEVSASSAIGGNETILLAEDEHGIRTMTRAYLESLGYRVLEAADGSEAIQIALEYSGRIDLVLSDLLMPGTRGDAAVRAIRAERPDIKAVFISGYPDRALEESGESLLIKPFELPELGQRLRAVLDAKPPNAARQFGPAAD